MSVKHSNEIEAEVIETGNGVTKHVLILTEEGSNFAIRRFVIKSCGKIPNHINQVEHEQYLLNSNAKISIGDEVFEVQKEDVVFITAEVSQRYTNFGEERFEFLYYMVPNKPDAIAILE